MTDLTRANYFDDPRISSSMLKELDRSPFHYRARFINRTVENKNTDALRKGRAIHCRLFEPDTFDARFPIFEGEKKTNEAKARYARLEAESSVLDGCVIREADYWYQSPYLDDRPRLQLVDRDGELALNVDGPRSNRPLMVGALPLGSRLRSRFAGSDRSLTDEERRR